MSDTTTCPNCQASLPAGAGFCTSCGTRVGEPVTEAAAPTPAAPPAAAPPADDATRVDNPALADTTQVYAPPPPAPSAPWQPAEAAAPPAAAPPWEAPAAPAPPPQAPSWQQPAPPPGAQNWGAPAAAAPPVWGAQAPAPAATATAEGSPLGGLLAVTGGVLTLIGIFTAWFDFKLAGTTTSISGWDLTKDGGLFDSKDPYLLLALAVGAIVIGVLLFTGTARSLVRIAAIVVGVVIVAVMVRDWLSIADVVKDINGAEATQKIGFFLAIAGGVVAAVAGLVPGKKTT